MATTDGQDASHQLRLRKRPCEGGVDGPDICDEHNIGHLRRTSIVVNIRIGVNADMRLRDFYHAETFEVQV